MPHHCFLRVFAATILPLTICSTAPSSLSTIRDVHLIILSAWWHRNSTDFINFQSWQYLSRLFTKLNFSDSSDIRAFNSRSIGAVCLSCWILWILVTSEIPIPTPLGPAVCNGEIRRGPSLEFWHRSTPLCIMLHYGDSTCYILGHKVTYLRDRQKGFCPPWDLQKFEAKRFGFYQVVQRLLLGSSRLPDHNGREFSAWKSMDESRDNRAKEPQGISKSER